jgi:hypothetical protein
MFKLCKPLHSRGLPLLPRKLVFRQHWTPRRHQLATATQEQEGARRETNLNDGRTIRQSMPIADTEEEN